GPEPPHLHRVEERHSEEQTAGGGACEVTALVPPRRPGAVRSLRRGGPARRTSFHVRAHTRCRPQTTHHDLTARRTLGRAGRRPAAGTRRRSAQVRRVGAMSDDGRPVLVRGGTVFDGSGSARAW